ncbi:MAG: hypothetical protein KDI83_03025 [Gammaproteobacteria bacterium]|nr:hypothetical protein [Gammaproteobacteria bacterium]
MDQFKVMVPGQTIAPKTGSAAKPKPLISAKSEVYDRSNPSYPLLQSPREALTGFPLDSLGRINWVAVLERGLIAPRAEKRTRGSMRVWDREILMKNTRDMPWVRFPHRQHTEWLACSNCHPDPFVEKAGTNQVNMEEIFRGNYCGKCHDRVAFSVFLCERCHSVTHPDSPTRWW